MYSNIYIVYSNIQRQLTSQGRVDMMMLAWINHTGSYSGTQESFVKEGIIYCSIDIAEHPNTTQFNPMFIYGPSGSGKTHLVNAIGLKAKQY